MTPFFIKHKLSERSVNGRYPQLCEGVRGLTGNFRVKQNSMGTKLS